MPNGQPGSARHTKAVEAPGWTRIALGQPHVLFWLFKLGTTATLLDAVEDLLGPNILLTTCAIWPKDAHDPRFVTCTRIGLFRLRSDGSMERLIAIRTRR